jgi:dCMP deaminase
MSRLGREQYYLNLAEAAAQRATCDRAKVGVVLVSLNTKRVVGMGYNGSPPGTAHCDDVGHVLVDDHCIRAIHAEMNALLHRISFLQEPLAAYCTHLPCWDCFKALYTAGVRWVHYSRLYGDVRILDWVPLVLPAMAILHETATV